MHTLNFRRLFYLCGSKAGLALLCLGVLVPAIGWSQGKGYVRRHLEFYDDEPIHYGFLLALPMSRFTIRHSDSFLSADSAYSIVSPAKAAFRVGFTINAFLTDHFDLRTTPAVSLYEREVKYSYPGPGDITRIENRESTWIEIPLLLKYKSVRRANTRMYLLGGVGFGIETNIKRRRGGGVSTQLDTKTSDITLEYGIGFEQFFQYFKFAPELRFSHGLGNLLIGGSDPANPGISRLTTHTVSLCLNFE